MRQRRRSTGTNRKIKRVDRTATSNEREIQSTDTFSREIPIDIHSARDSRQGATTVGKYHKGTPHGIPSQPKKSGNSSVPPPPSSCAGNLYEIQSGDTLYKLAVSNGVTLEAMLAANPQVANPDQLTVGQIICIPTGPESMMEIINTALAAERIEIAMYARGLKSPALEGLPADQYAYFQAALSHESAHRDELERLGASVPYTEFYYPPGTFEDREVFLNTILMIESAGVAAYTQASIEFGRMGRFDMARTASRIMGVEAEHRALIRSVLNLVPANNLCFEIAPDEPVSVILSAVPNFLIPDQFDGASVGPVPLPSRATIAELVGPNGCPNPTP